EVGKLELEDRPQACYRSADGNAGTAQLGDRRVDHALRPEPLDKGSGYLEGAAIDADVLTHEDDALVRFHGERHRLLDRLRIGEFARAALCDPFRCDVHQAGSSV